MNQKSMVLDLNTKQLWPVVKNGVQRRLKVRDAIDLTTRLELLMAV
jgi:hypothetical protein